VADYLESGQLIDVGPAFILDVPLYWHFWQTESAPLAALRHAVIDHASRVLL